MDLAKITSRGQTTIPKRIREAVNLHEGDVIAFEIEGDYMRVRKVFSGQDDYLKGIAESFSEWNSPEDEKAWHDL